MLIALREDSYKTCLTGFWFPISFRVLNFAVLDNLAFIPETDESTQETLLGFGINNIVWVCRMTFVSGFTTFTMLLGKKCRKQLQSSLTWFINITFFSYKKASQLKSHGLWAGFFVWFCSEGLCTLAGLQMSQTGHSGCSVTLFKVLGSWGDVHLQEGVAESYCSSWLCPSCHTAQTLALHDFWTLQKENKCRQLSVLCGQSTFLSSSSKLSASQCLELNPDKLCMCNLEHWDVCSRHSHWQWAMELLHWHFKVQDFLHRSSISNSPKKEGTRVCNIPMRKNWSCHLRWRNWITDLVVADIQLRNTQKGITGIPELVTRICLAIKLPKQNLGSEDLWGKKAHEKNLQ